MEGLALTVPQKDSETKTGAEAMEKEAESGRLMLLCPTAVTVPEVFAVPIVADDVAATTAGVAEAKQKIKTRKGKERMIQVSNTKNPFIFYLNLAKKHIRQHDQVELCALGMAITTVVTIAERLKRMGLAVEKSIKIDSVDRKDTESGRLVQKARIEILMEKPKNAEEGSTNSEPAAVSEATPLVAMLSI